MRSIRNPVLNAVTLAVLVQPAIAGATWVVARVPGPGVDFTKIQDAVDAASDGDVVLVRSGSYAGFTVDGKGITIQEDAGNVAESSAMVVRNLSSAQTLVVRGLSIRSVFQSILFVNVWSIDLRNNQGTIWLEDSDVETTSFFSPGNGGILADSSSRVVLVRCTVRAGHSGDGDNPTFTSHGIESINSNLFLFDCDSKGGFGPGGECGDPFAGCFDIDGGTGGNGLDVRGGSVFAYSSIFTGGDGNLATCCFGGPTCICNLDGTGGIGANLFNATFRYLGTALRSGSGPGFPGTDISTFGSTVVDLGQRGVRKLDVSSPASSGAAVPATLTGRAGDLAFVYSSITPDADYRPELLGTLLLGLPGTQVSMHFLTVNGANPITLPAMSLPGMSGSTQFLQPIVRNSKDRVFLGSGSTLTILAP